MKRIRLIWACMAVSLLSACAIKETGEDITEGKVGVMLETEVDTTIKETKPTIEIIKETQNIGETLDTKNTEIITEAESKTEQSNAGDLGRKEAYKAVLENLYYHNTLPNGNDYGFNEFRNITDNRFAIFDIDSDGKEELIIEFTTTMLTSGMVEVIYGYMPESKMVKEELTEYPILKFYKNGVIEALWSHNHSMSEALWPYTLYQYNPETDTYLVVATIEAWEKSISDTKGEIVFPDQADIDGDGIVYYIQAEGEYGYHNPVDFAEYKEWRESYIGDGTEIQIPFLNLTEENNYNIK